ncbi:MAG: extracellular solute-binding protein [Candidatus Cloacimonetes bacterium]|nr:extracellular solute-binding protein [Candidatus Cloacimonadota bacterium]
MKQRLILVLCLLFSLNAGYLSASAKPIVIKVFELPDPRHTDAYSKANLAVVAAFREKYPEIELQAFSGIKIEGMDLDSGPLLAIAGGVAPDILYVNFRQSDTYIQNNLLYPLDEFIRHESDEAMDLRVEKPVWQVIRRKKKGDQQERVWALPYETLVRVLMYRKDLFKKVGLNPNVPPRDWDEFLDYAKRLTDPASGTYGTVFGDRATSCL